MSANAEECALVAKEARAASSTEGFRHVADYPDAPLHELRDVYNQEEE